MEWTTKDGLVTCNIEADEFQSLRETLRDARGTKVLLSLQNFPADYAEVLLKPMMEIGEVNGQGPWTPEEKVVLAGAWRSQGNSLTQRAFLRNLAAEPPPVLVRRTDKAVVLNLAKKELVKGHRPWWNSYQEQMPETKLV